jgi:hypothetical protein
LLFVDEPNELGRRTLFGNVEEEGVVVVIAVVVVSTFPPPPPSNRPRNRPELLDKSCTQSATISSVGVLVSGVNLTDRLLRLLLFDDEPLSLCRRRNAGRSRRARRRSDDIDAEQLSFSSSVNSSSVVGPSAMDGDVTLRADMDGREEANAYTDDETLWEDTLLSSSSVLLLLSVADFGIC